MKQLSSVKNMAFIAILAAILCLLAPVSIPVTAIPVSLASFAVYIIAACVKTRQSVIAVIVYILLGAFGLPVFSAFTGGFHRIAGITGGYIIGYVPCALTVSLLTEKFGEKNYIYPLSMAIGTLECYLIGTLWYAVQADVAFTQALSVCVLPFVIGDIIKITAASALAITLKKHKIRSVLK